MKKIILLFVLGTFFLGSKSQAQHFVASFGVERTWNLPRTVTHTVKDHYYGYDWVHAKRVIRNGNISFDVVLQRGDLFVEVNIGSNGRIYRTTNREYYPLYEHVCDAYCGYHPVYYSSYVTTCNAHHHRGHNHIVYRPRTTYTYVNSHHAHNQKHIYKKNKGHIDYGQKSNNSYGARRDNNRKYANQSSRSSRSSSVSEKRQVNKNSSRGREAKNTSVMRKRPN